MGYLSLYRRWRPRTFDEIVGQEHVTKTLKNALSLGKVAHAYLFCGPRGTGKTSVAKVLAKALNCEKGPTANPCDVCEACKRIREGYSMDVIEIDAASNRGIDEIRDLREKVKFAAAEERYKVYIIDEVHMLTTEAFNALLKTLEEPPAYVVFVLATTEPHRIPATILSRCQRFDFRRLTVPEIAGQLKDISHKEGINLEERAAGFLAKNAEGSMRDALSLLDQCTAFGTNEITYETVVEVLGAVGSEGAREFADLVARRDLLGGLSFIQRLSDEGKDLRQFVKDAVEHFRDLLIVKECSDPARLVDSLTTTLQELQRQAGAYTVDDIQRVIDVMCAAESEMRWAARPRLVMEMAFVRLVRLRAAAAGEAPAGDAGDLLGRVKMLEETVKRLRAALQDLQNIQKRKRPAPQSDTEVAEEAGAAPDNRSEIARSEATEVVEVARPDTGVVQPGAFAAGLTIKDVKARWPEVLEALKIQRKMRLRGYLLDAAPVDVERDCILLGFQHVFHKEQIESQAHRAVIQETLSAVFGQPVRVRCEIIQHAEDLNISGLAAVPTSAGGSQGAGKSGGGETEETLDTGKWGATDGAEEDRPGVDDSEPEGGAGREMGNEAAAAIAATLESQGNLVDNRVVKEVLDLFGGHILKIESRQR